MVYLYLVIPAILETMTIILICYALINSACSVFSMLFSLTLFINALISKFFFNKIMYRHHYFGICVLILGALVIGVWSTHNIEYGNDSLLNPTKLSGIILAVCAVITSSA
jgi:drug/metabolite transporter (DMT)-like permease